MIPTTVGSLVSFLLLLAPGILWELLRARRQPGVKQTALVELSRIVLFSLVATATSVAILFWVWSDLYRAPMNDGQWPNSLSSAVPYILAVATTSGGACLVVGALGLVLRLFGGKSRIKGVRVWHQAFVEWKKADSESPYLIVEMLSDTTWRGCLKAFDSDPEDSQRSIALGPPLSRKRPQDGGFTSKSPRVATVILPEGQIRSIQIAHPPRS